MKVNNDPFHALADANRRQILTLLTQRSQSVNELASNFNISRPAISKHIKILYVAGLIEINEKGRENYCELKAEGFKQVTEWFDFFEDFWKAKLQNFEKLINQKYK